MQIDLDRSERNLILTMMVMVKPIIHEPKAGREIRDTYRRLKEKLKRDESLSKEIRDTAGDGKIKLTGIEPTRPSK